MKDSPIHERGQILVIVALLMVGLVAITGLAIDGSMVFADRRQAQNATDSAALAGAFAYVKECEVTGCDCLGEISDAKAAMQIAALDRASSNGYSSNLICSEVFVNTCDDPDAS